MRGKIKCTFIQKFSILYTIFMGDVYPANRSCLQWYSQRNPLKINSRDDGVRYKLSLPGCSGRDHLPFGGGQSFDLVPSPSPFYASPSWSRTAPCPATRATPHPRLGKSAVPLLAEVVASQGRQPGFSDHSLSLSPETPRKLSISLRSSTPGLVRLSGDRESNEGRHSGPSVWLPRLQGAGHTCASWVQGSEQGSSKAPYLQSNLHLDGSSSGESPSSLLGIRS